MSTNRNELITENMKLVYYVLNKYYHKYIGDEDMIQVGMVGLVKAADKFDESKSKFSTFAVLCIRHAIQDELRKRNKEPKMMSLEDLMEDNHNSL